MLIIKVVLYISEMCTCLGQHTNGERGLAWAHRYQHGSTGLLVVFIIVHLGHGEVLIGRQSKTLVTSLQCKQMEMSFRNVWFVPLSLFSRSKLHQVFTKKKHTHNSGAHSTHNSNMWTFPASTLAFIFLYWFYVLLKSKGIAQYKQRTELVLVDNKSAYRPTALLSKNRWLFKMKHKRYRQNTLNLCLVSIKSTAGSRPLLLFASRSHK